MYRKVVSIYKSSLIVIIVIVCAFSNDFLKKADELFENGEYPRAYKLYKNFIDNKSDTTKETFYAKGHL